MALVVEKQETVFDTENIRVGDFIMAKRTGWETYRNGLVTMVAEQEIRILFLPGIGNVSNYFVVRVSELLGWVIRWSSDLEKVQEYMPPLEEGDEGPDADGGTNTPDINAGQLLEGKSGIV